MGGLKQDLFDISKRMGSRVISKMARRFTHVPLAELLGTVVIGDVP
jgi:hypothetical protein